MEIQEKNFLVFNGNDLTPINLGFTQIIDKIKKYEPRKCLYLGYGEYELPGGMAVLDHPSYQELIDYCLINQIDFYFIFNANDDNYYNKLKKNDRIKFFSWPTYYLHHTFHHINDDELRKNLFNISLEEKFTKLYVSFNNRPHYHRQVLMEQLCENNLLDYGKISWNILKKDYHHNVKNLDFNCWVEQNLSIDNFNQYTNYYHINSEYLNYSLSDCLINLIAESNTTCQFITEKTYKPLLVGQPFICFGSKNQNKILTKYGFELYDEIFDYGFDDLDNLEERCKGVIYNLNKIKDQNYYEIYETIKPKILRNRENARSLLKNDKNIPRAFISMYNLDKSKFEEKVETYIDNIITNSEFL